MTLKMAKRYYLDQSLGILLGLYQIDHEESENHVPKKLGSTLGLSDYGLNLKGN